jgi:peptidoglycan glycosyltransferase
VNLLEPITALLNGDHGRAVLAVLRVLMLLALAYAAGRLMLAPRPGGSGFRLLAWGFSLALCGVLLYQATWQLTGLRRPAFVVFLRRYNPRPDSPEKQVRRGRILDWQGRVLAESESGDAWGRVYPLGRAAAHVVGYVHPVYGWAGVERAADAVLSGYGFTNLREFDRFGLNLLDRHRAAGSDIALTLDARLQRRAAELLTGRAGAVIALRPADGALLALASAPSFDPANPGPDLNDDVRAPMLNRATHGLYPPGSTFKIVLAALASEIGRAPRFDCPAEGFSASAGATPIRDSEYYIYAREGREWPGWGRIGLEDGFVHSSNVYFSQLGLSCGAAAFNRAVSAAHLTDRLVCFADAAAPLASAPGRVPAATEGQRRALAQLSIGQGKMLLTPLHVALVTAAVAARGEIWQPRLRADETPARLGRLTTVRAAATVHDLMREAVARGTGRPADLPGLQVCGKTGTAEAAEGEDHAWFTCFAPGPRPALVVTVLIEHGGYGSRAAVPVARAILETAAGLGLLDEATPPRSRGPEARP